MSAATLCVRPSVVTPSTVPTCGFATTSIEKRDVPGPEYFQLDMFRHHRSGNATPKSLWELMTGAENSKKAGPLLSLISTEKDVYNNVPRMSLLKALTDQGQLHSTVPMREKGCLSETVVLK